MEFEKIPDEEVFRQYEYTNAWGLQSSIDLYKCDKSIITDATAIRNFVYQLCDLIGMKRFGECQVVHFGEDDRVAGYSMVQLIETSLISGHFANKTGTSYIDVFSCKCYSPKVTAAFAVNFFNASGYKLSHNFRY